MLRLVVLFQLICKRKKQMRPKNIDKSNRCCTTLCKRCQIYFIGLKKTCLGVLERGDRDKDNETSLKEGGGLEMSTTVLHSRAALSLEYLPVNIKYNMEASAATGLYFSRSSLIVISVAFPFLTAISISVEAALVASNPSIKATSLKISSGAFAVVIKEEK